MTRAPRIAVVVKGWPRLSETFIAQELHALERRGLDLEIWSLRRPTDAKRHRLHDEIEAPVRYLPEYLRDAPLTVLAGLGAGLFRRGFWPALGAWLKDFRRDPTRNRVRRFGQALVLARAMPRETAALYAHFMHTPGSVARYAAILRGLAWGFSAHAKDIWTIPEWEKREKIAAARFGATCTASGAAHLAGLADAPEKIRLVYHGLDLGRFPPPPERRAERTGVAGFPIRILSVGRLVEKKGFDRLVAALALLPPDLDWRWVHIGGGPLGPSLAAEAEKLGLGPRIDWRGPADQSEVVAAMREADIFALPSRIAADGDRDGLPNVLMEAASQKLAILSTPVSAIPEFIEDEVHGLLRPDAPEALAAALAALACEPARRRRLGTAAYERLVDAFGVEAGVAELERLLRGLAASGPAPSAEPAAPASAALGGQS